MGPRYAPAARAAPVATPGIGREVARSILILAKTPTGKTTPRTLEMDHKTRVRAAARLKPGHSPPKCGIFLRRKCGIYLVSRLCVSLYHPDTPASGLFDM